MPWPRPKSPRPLLAALLLVLLSPAACKEGSNAPESAESDPPQARAEPGPAPDPTGPTPLDGRRQLLEIAAPSWNSRQGKLELWSRGEGGDWQRLDVWKVNLGERGLAWGIGLHGSGRVGELSGPTKTEGDGRTPAGLFEIGAAYGYADAAETELDYAPVDEGWRCVDDPASPRYGEIFDADGVEPDWGSAEKMRGDHDLYRWVIAVGHNRERTRGRGSCIFLHIWDDPGSSTRGCAAMPEERMRTLLGWLRPEARPAIAVLPESARRLLRPRWGLP